MPPTCPKCRYDLTAHLGKAVTIITCPECGTQTDVKDFAEQPGTARKAWTAWFCAIGGGAFILAITLSTILDTFDPLLQRSLPSLADTWIIECAPLTLIWLLWCILTAWHCCTLVRGPRPDVQHTGLWAFSMLAALAGCSILWVLVPMSRYIW